MLKKTIKGVLIVNGLLFLPNAIYAMSVGWKAGRDGARAGKSFSESWADAKDRL